MHVPDGFFTAAASVSAGVVSAGTIGMSLKKAARDLTDRLVPMAGLVAAFVFALQMLNFPVAAGTSGHLLGGVLAGVLVGPWLGSLAVAVVLFVQSLVFADGGLTAYGLNVLLIATIPTFAGYGLFLLLRKVLPRNRGGVTTATSIAAFLSVPIAAAAFAALFAIGGSVGVPLGAVLSAMVGVHLLIGIGEAAITAAVVGAVLGTRPDLVHGARDLTPELELRSASPVGAAAA
jgi:cobalt/nickel transport system permease protein